MKEVMAQNLNHLSEGKSIDSMPVNFEIIEMGEAAPSAQDTTAPTLDKEIEPEAPAVEDPSPQQPANAEPETSIKKPGLWQRINHWLNTPWKT